jgi:hypothetical protein
VAIDPSRHPLLHLVWQGARWAGQDAYPTSPKAADEHERWLEFIDQKGEIGRFLPRLRDCAAKRDETLAEIAVGYFLDPYCGLPIAAWEPPGANGKKGEYLVSLPDGRNMFVEVKAPGWEEEVVDAEGRNSPRLSQWKHIDGEGRRLTPWKGVRGAIGKAYPKMPDTMPTLLVIKDDQFVALHDWLSNVKIALYCPRGAGDYPNCDYLAEDGSFVGSAYKRLGALGILNVDFLEGSSGASFRFTAFDNPNCLPAVAVPPGIFPGPPRCDAREDR